MEAEEDGSIDRHVRFRMRWIEHRRLLDVARPCRAGAPAQSPATGAPAVPRSGAALI
jgi:hypothetical protein